MKEREYLLNIYEIYKKLLNPKEREYFEFYYYEDYSLQEIADNNNVSKSYVGKFINRIEKKILKYEDLLQLYKRNLKIKEIIQNMNESLREKIEELL